MLNLPLATITLTITHGIRDKIIRLLCKVYRDQFETLLCKHSETKSQ